MRTIRTRALALAAATLAAGAVAREADAHLCDNVFRQADKLVINPETQNVIVKDVFKLKVWLQNNMDRGIAQIRMAGVTDAFDVTVTPESMQIPKGVKAAFEVELRVKPGVRSGNYPVTFRLFAVKEGKEQEFKRFELGAAAGKAGAPEPRQACVPRLAAGETVRIDGDPSEPAWKRAVVLSGFTAAATSKPAVNQTIGLATYDDTHLHLAVACLETEAAEDAVAVRIVPPGPGTRVHEVRLAHNVPPKVRVLADGRWSDVPADTLVAMVARRERQWTAELSLPWKLVGGPPKVPQEAKDEPWRLNVVRERSGPRPETSFWAGAAGTFRQPASFGRLSFSP